MRPWSRISKAEGDALSRSASAGVGFEPEKATGVQEPAPTLAKEEKLSNKTYRDKTSAVRMGTAPTDSVGKPREDT